MSPSKAMIRKEIYKIGVGFWLLLLLAACQSSDKKNSDEKLKIVTIGTTGMIADALRELSGDRAENTLLMGPGVDPHLYKVTQGDLAKLREADIIFYNGLHLEGKMGEVLEKLAAQKKVVAFSDGVEREQLRHSGEQEGAYDPHIWFDVALWSKAVSYAARQLEQADTSNKEYYAANAALYLQRLDSLDHWVGATIRTIPVESRLLITAHDAFGYFGEAYGIEVKGLQGISTVSDYGLSDVKSLVDLIVQKKIKAIFVEASVSDRSIRAVVEGCRARGHEVRIGGTLYSDSMGSAGTPEATYIGMVSSNVNTIVNALR
jgi:manganese/zinc/iron transport system substrate-binding protein